MATLERWRGNDESACVCYYCTEVGAPSLYTPFERCPRCEDGRLIQNPSLSDWLDCTSCGILIKANPYSLPEFAEEILQDAFE